jgi:hypothetical protein
MSASEAVPEDGMALFIDGAVEQGLHLSNPNISLIELRESTIHLLL